MGEDISSADLFKDIKQTFELPDADIRAYSPLVLAYIGDGIFDIVIRSAVSGNGGLSAGAMNKKTAKLVKACAQAKMMKYIRPLLTKEEDDVYRRGRNAHPHTKARHATVSDYRKATGFEALMGYLYLSGRTQRMLELIKAGKEGLKEDA